MFWPKISKCLEIQSFGIFGLNNLWMQLNITMLAIEQINKILCVCECIEKIWVSGNNQRAHVNALSMEYKINNGKIVRLLQV